MCFIAATDSQPNSTSWSTYLSLSCLCCGWLLGQTRRWGCSELHYKEWGADGPKLINLSELSCGAPACSSERQALQPVAEYVSAVRETISLLSSFCWFQKSRSTLGFNGLSAQFLLFSFSFVGVVLVSLLHSVSACPLQRQHVQYFLDSVSWWLALVASNLFLLQIAQNGNLCTCVCARNQEAGLLEVELWLDLKLSLGFWI